MFAFSAVATELEINTRHDRARILALQRGKGKSDFYPTLEYLTKYCADFKRNGKFQI
jgi:hypothetical protein